MVLLCFTLICSTAIAIRSLIVETVPETMLLNAHVPRSQQHDLSLYSWSQLLSLMTSVLRKRLSKTMSQTLVSGCPEDPS